MTEKKSLAALVLGLILVAVGCLFLWINIYGLEVRWFSLLRFIVPTLILWMGLSKLVRHFLWSESQLLEHPHKSSLLGGIFWTCLGSLLLFDMLYDLEALRLIGLYWPFLLIFFGLGKIIDFYRLKGRLQFRPRELFGIVFIIFLGIVCHRLAEAHFRLIPVDLPLILREGGGISVSDLGGEKYRWETVETVPAGGLSGVQIRNLYGDVRIEALLTDNIEVRLGKEVVETSEKRARRIAEEIVLSSRREGDTLQIDTNREQLDKSYRFNTHLTVRLPENLQVGIINRYGDVRISRVKGPCDLKNAYGGVTVDSAGGNVTISNEYRQVTAKNVNGNLDIKNRRGPISIEDVGGRASLVTDYDSITTRGVQGDLSIENRFGNVRIENVSGKVVVKAPGSSVRVSRAQKAVYVENSHQNVEVRDVSDALELDTSYGRVTLADIRGPATVRAVHSDITARDLSSGLVLQAKGSAVKLTEVSGPVRIATSLRQVVVSEFRGRAEIENEFGSVVLSPTGPLTEGIRVNNRNGEITLSLPSQSAFRLFAQASGGKVISDFKPAPGSSGQGVELLELNVGQGGPEIRLQTTYAQIRVRKK